MAIIDWLLYDRVGGVMFLDDYEWQWPGHAQDDLPRIAIDAFVACYTGQLAVVFKGAQVALRKVTS